MLGKKALVLFSGGQDSTVCLYWAKENFNEVHPLVIFYGQNHKVEIDAALKIATDAEVSKNTELIELPPHTLMGGTLLNQKSEAKGSIADTWVPYRNMLFLVLAFNRALIKGCNFIITGVNAVDYSGYPDCRLAFIDAIEYTAKKASEKFISIQTPLIDMSKKEIVELGLTLPGCMEALAYSHTCYNGQVPPCGECPACKLRAKGFFEAGVKDPLIERLTNA